MISGIYKITNIINGRFYIGSSKNCRKRKNEHFARLKVCKHGNQKLQRAYNKYGVGNFIFELIHEVKSIDILEGTEQYYLDILKPYYNICPIANSIAGISRRKEWAAKIAASNTGKKLSAEHRKKLSLAKIGKSPTNKGVPSSGKEAGKALSINIGNIASCCTGKRKSKKTGGYIWQMA